MFFQLSAARELRQLVDFDYGKHWARGKKGYIVTITACETTGPAR